MDPIQQGQAHIDVSIITPTKNTADTLGERVGKTLQEAHVFPYRVNAASITHGATTMMSGY